ncbi:MAG: hypothetical protein ACFCGT_07110 [Sandaracinaceae bacterium]
MRAEGWRRGRLRILVLVVLSACDGCQDHSVAYLDSHVGEVERDHQAHIERWEEAGPGDRFFLGDGVRTAAEATAVLGLRGGAELQMDPSTLVRFRLPGEDPPDDGGDARVDVSEGSAGRAAAPEEGQVSVRTALGRAVLMPGTRVRLNATPTGRRFEVLIGMARVEQEGEVREYETGAVLDVSIGRAEIEEVGSAVLDGVSAPPPADTTAPAQVELEVAAGEVRSQTPERQGWASLPAGVHAVEAGTRVRVGGSGRAAARRGADEVLLDGAALGVIGDAGGPLLKGEAGRMTVVARQASVEVRVSGGTVEALAGTGGGSRAALRIDPDGTDVTALDGQVRVAPEGRPEVILRAGETARIDAGAEPPDPGSGAEVAGLSVGRDSAIEGPARSDFRAPAGSTFTVHVPRAPVVVGLAFGGRCPDGGVVEVRRAGAVSGRGAANLTLRRGVHRYALRCLGPGGRGPTVAEGTVRVRIDSGRRRLPRTPPATVIDADGRPYTVLYQTRLPSITIRWLDAPSSGPFRLRFDRGGGRRVPTTSREARFRLPSGSLPEGEHRFVMSAPSGSSRPTTLRIRFDNAAPTASVSSPRDRGFRPGERVRVAGIAQTGWSVSVAGEPLPLDAQYRFDAEVVAPADQTGLAIRLAHPRRGIHYYVRRARGTR